MFLSNVKESERVRMAFELKSERWKESEKECESARKKERKRETTKGR